MTRPRVQVHPWLSGNRGGGTCPAAEAGGVVRGVFLEEGVFEIGLGRGAGFFPAEERCGSGGGEV